MSFKTNSFSFPLICILCQPLQEQVCFDETRCDACLVWLSGTIKLWLSVPSWYWYWMDTGIVWLQFLLNAEYLPPCPVSSKIMQTLLLSYLDIADFALLSWCHVMTQQHLEQQSDSRSQTRPYLFALFSPDRFACFGGNWVECEWIFKPSDSGSTTIKATSVTGEQRRNQHTNVVPSFCFVQFFKREYVWC